MQPELVRAAMSSIELRCQRAAKEKQKMRYPNPLCVNTKEKLEACLSETSAFHIQDSNGENHSMKREEEGNYSTPTHPYLTSQIHVLTIRICTQVLISVQIL